MAAGRGSRLSPLTDTMPKCMVELNGKPLIGYIQKAAENPAISAVGVVVGYLAEKVETFDWIVVENKRWRTTNMIESLLSLDEWLSCDDCVVTYSDIFYGKEALVSLIKESTSSISILYSDSWKQHWIRRFENPLEDAENYKISKDSEVLKISGRANSMDDIDGQYMGLIKFTPLGWKVFKEKYLATKNANIDVTNLLSLLIEDNNYSIEAIKYSGVWGEIDSLSDLNFYESSINFKSI